MLHDLFRWQRVVEYIHYSDGDRWLRVMYINLVRADLWQFGFKHYSWDGLPVRILKLGRLHLRWGQWHAWLCHDWSAPA